MYSSKDISSVYNLVTHQGEADRLFTIRSAVTSTDSIVRLYTADDEESFSDNRRERERERAGNRPVVEILVLK